MSGMPGGVKRKEPENGFEQRGRDPPEARGACSCGDYWGVPKMSRTNTKYFVCGNCQGWAPERPCACGHYTAEEKTSKTGKVYEKCGRCGCWPPSVEKKKEEAPPASGDAPAPAPSAKPSPSLTTSADAKLPLPNFSLQTPVASFLFPELVRMRKMHTDAVARIDHIMHVMTLDPDNNNN